MASECKSTYHVEEIMKRDKRNGQFIQTVI